MGTSRNIWAGALALMACSAVTSEVRAESELDAIREQNELLRVQIEQHADQIRALQDQNLWLRQAAERSDEQGTPVTRTRTTDTLPAVGLGDDWTLNGHFLLRHYYYGYDDDPRGVEQHSNSPTQYRALLTVSKNVSSSLNATVQFGTGGGTPRGLESTLGGGADFDTDSVFINQAYITWTPTAPDARFQMDLQAGKAPNPFSWGTVTGEGLLPSDLVYWDGTFTQEGASLIASYELSESTDLHGVASAFVVDANATSKDPRLFAGQLAASHRLSRGVRMGLRGTWYEWRALDSDFVTRATSGGNLFSAIDRDEQTRIVELGGFALLGESAPWPVRLYGSASRNLAANSTVIGSVAVGEEDTAWTTGVELGRPEKLLVGLNYANIEANSVLSNFKDGIPTDGFTNREEWHLYAARKLMPGITLTLDLFASDALEDTGAFSGCTAGSCGPFETSISNSDRTLVMTNLVFDF